MKFGLKWVHMARYELILRLDGALWVWLMIISKNPPDPKKGHGRTKKSKRICVKARTHPPPPPLYAHVLTGYFGTAT